MEIKRKLRISDLKKHIKYLALDQKQVKEFRKTGSYETVKDRYGYPIHPQCVTRSNKAAALARKNQVYITAALNLYHYLKDPTYEGQYHSIPEDSYEYQVYYYNYYDELYAEYAVE